jgi:hypothetical protein
MILEQLAVAQLVNKPAEFYGTGRLIMFLKPATGTQPDAKDFSPHAHSIFMHDLPWSQKLDQ